MGIKGSTPVIACDSSISSLEKMKIGNLDQWILIRGENVNNPIVLFLHGGPGNAQIGWAPEHQSLLEKSYIVVNWDQRGSGLSYNDGISEETMNIDQFVQDAHELTVALANRFQKKKIFVVGHSWGSIIGMLLIQRYPELFYSYIGVGQSVHLARGEWLSYKFTMDYAEKNKIQEAIDELTQIGCPPYQDMLKGLFIQRKWLNQFGGVVYKHREFFRRTEDTIRDRTEYTDADIVKLRKGNLFSIETMWAEVLNVNLFQQIIEVKVPVYFLLGKYDYNTPNEITEEFFNILNAPSKELIRFEESAHNIPFEEPERFAVTLRHITAKHFHP
ncbi:alpha/beta fold hydrolase [Paenibacillus harenae]|uniref:alpha/beta fold hydrolase n=1 Tax=Paenibacillus harenae TaxID=306543 RepID=UPI000688CCA3|nr:alpha/beta hydrolase [Paenibacillus harenae]